MEETTKEDKYKAGHLDRKKRSKSAPNTTGTASPDGIVDLGYETLTASKCRYFDANFQVMQMMENAHQVIYFLWEESFLGVVKKSYVAKSIMEVEYIACISAISKTVSIIRERI